MNKNAIQKFAIWARNELISQVSQRAYQYGIEESGFGDASADAIGGRLLTAEEKSQRQELIRQIREKGYKQVMEEVAYTWFNRFTALRFMEVNNYLPSHIRVFSDSTGAFRPEILGDALHLDLPGLDGGKVAEYIESNDTEGLYRYLLLTQCNALNESLPVMFERMGGYTEMLLPNNILRQDSVLGRMVEDIPEEDWRDAVQIIGWLYQYYNTELKDDTFANLKKNVKISKERIPAATQLFTPDWIVRYMVENSVGRLWLDGHPDDELRGGWKYYLDEAEQKPEVEAQLEKLREEYRKIKPEEIKVIDPCMGSGHILVYAFDVLMKIYTSAGWDQRDAAQSILRNNLYGLDIDDRAAQLAYFAVMMKARQYDRRLLTRGIQPNLFAIRESGHFDKDKVKKFVFDKAAIDYFCNGDDNIRKTVNALIDMLFDAKEYGSVIEVTPQDWDCLYARFDEIRNETGMFNQDLIDRMLLFVKQAQVLSQKYDVVVTNPPYMGGSGMNNRLSEYLKEKFQDGKNDLFACFIERGNDMIKKHGYNCMVTMQSWMFLSSFEKLREKLLSEFTITNLMHMENMVMGIAFGTAVTVFRNDYIKGYKGTYNQIKMCDIEDGHPREFPVKGNRFAQVSAENFSKIPGCPVAYWVGEKFVATFNEDNLGKIAIAVKGLDTCDNQRYVRQWEEVDISSIGFNITDSSKTFGKKWYPYCKGGGFCRWYGFNEMVVNWLDDGKELRNLRDNDGRIKSRPQNIRYYFKEGLTWSSLTSYKLSLRYMNNAIFGGGGSAMFTKCDLNYVLALINSNVSDYYLSLLNPTINFLVGDIMSIPYVVSNTDEVDKLAKENISLSKSNYDSFETSWDFKRNPLI